MEELWRLGTARGGGERVQMEQASASGRHWLSSGARMHDVEALAEHACHAVNRSYAGRPRRALTIFENGDSVFNDYA